MPGVVSCAFFGAASGAVTALFLRGLYPVRHRDMIDLVILSNAAAAMYLSIEKSADVVRDNVSSFVGRTLAMVYVVGGTPMTRQLSNLRVF